ncbi:MAG TPA: glycerol-3-phosphate dehydrogenase/oxidase [Acidimicrobiales bacterium]|nr:glycerol-3-phosphate dehydrogenase/oxidase [Acidimicrobiales bacterium]
MTFDRPTALRRLADEHFDVLVVGGGVTGAGTALDAASRGLRTALVERHDFASGTSSKSSKLVHGGLRYLQQREFRLVYEALAERQRLRRTAPHLVRLLPFLIPVLGKGGVIHPKLAKALNSALWLYDLTGGARIGKLHQRISAEETLAHMPTLRAERVVGGFVYYDAQTDDARLTLTLARTAADHGAAVANRCSVVGITKGLDGRVAGVTVRPEEGGADIEVAASVVVNATGVWSDEVRALDEGGDPDSIRPAKGIHITVPWDKVRNDIAAVVPVPKDKRSVFVVPVAKGAGTADDGPDRTYVGTTDTDYDGPLDDPQCTPDDVAYLLGAINASVSEPLSTDDVLGTWAGLRPLVKGADAESRTADLSRRHKVAASETGMITVTGGKLTTYRKMAADTIDAAVDALGRGGRSRTKKLRLRGAEGFTELVSEATSAAERLGVTAELLDHLSHRHGGDARTVAAMVTADPTLGEPIVEGLPYVRAEVVYAVRYEMARTVDDVLTRRMPARWLDGLASADAADETARLMAPDLGWSQDEAAAEAEAFRRSVMAQRAASGLPQTTTPAGR